MHPLTTNKSTPTQDVHGVGFESSADDLIDNIALQLAHAARPGVVGGSLELNELPGLGVRQDQELFGFYAFDDCFGNLLGADHAGVLVDAFACVLTENRCRRHQSIGPGWIGFFCYLEGGLRAAVSR